MPRRSSLRAVREFAQSTLTGGLCRSFDEVVSRLVGSLWGYLEVYAVGTVEDDFSILGSDLGCFVIERIAVHTGHSVWPGSGFPTDTLSPSELIAGMGGKLPLDGGQLSAPMCYGDILPTASSESVAEREWRAPAAQGSPNMLHDRYYDAARAAEERSLAMASVSLKVRAIHLDLAARYDARVEANTDRWPAAEPLDESEAEPVSSGGRTGR